MHDHGDEHDEYPDTCPVCRDSGGLRCPRCGGSGRVGESPMDRDDRLTHEAFDREVVEKSEREQQGDSQ